MATLQHPLTVSIESSPSRKRSEFATAGILFVAAFIVTTAMWIWLPSPGFGKGYESVALAKNLAERAAFANPFAAAQTGPSAHLPPLFPLYLAALIRIFGFSAGFVLAASLITVGVHALHAALLPFVSKLFFQETVPGVYAAVLSIVLPALQFTPQWEALYVADGLMAFCLASAWIMRGGARSPLQGFAPGLLCGLLILLNPMSVVICFLWLLFVLTSKRVTQNSAVGVFAAFFLAIFLVCLPWTLRNYHQFHQWFFIRDNFGVELYAANNSLASSSDAVNHLNGCHFAMQPTFNLAEAETVKRLGEVEYNRDRLDQALNWIQSHPARFLELTVRRFLEFWFPNPATVTIYSYSIWLITALSFAGLWLMIRSRLPATGFVAIVFLIYPAVYYLLQSSVRYRYPVLWLSLLPAGYALRRLVAAAKQPLSRAADLDRIKPLWHALYQHEF
ncbi:MAG TPA: hypothetical protein VMT32_00105 [Bryobacteraceae bacterium]|nr:hypothetical protein [Bryobacteraceae bacterium]